MPINNVSMLKLQLDWINKDIARAEKDIKELYRKQSMFERYLDTVERYLDETMLNRGYN